MNSKYNIAGFTGQRQWKDRLSFTHPTSDDRVEAFLYPGEGFTDKELEAIESRDCVRWHIGPWPCRSKQFFFPEHLDPKSLRAALKSAQQILVNVFDAPDEAGWAACYHALWDQCRLSQGLDIPTRITLLEIPALSADHWPPIIQEWSDCSVRMHRVVSGTTDGEFEPWWLPHEHKTCASNDRRGLQ